MNSPGQPLATCYQREPRCPVAQTQQCAKGRMLSIALTRIVGKHGRATPGMLSRVQPLCYQTCASQMVCVIQTRSSSTTHLAKAIDRMLSSTFALWPTTQNGDCNE
jgi:hypothetical protein